jgi:rubrerythrin
LCDQIAQKLAEINELLQQQAEIDKKLAVLLGITVDPDPVPPIEQPAPKRKGGRPSGSGHTKFTDEFIEKILNEIEETGDTATEVCERNKVALSAFSHAKKRYLKRKENGEGAASAALPAYDAADDNEAPDDAPAERLHIPDNLPAPPKRYSYECPFCGLSFKSGIPPQLIKCPDCGGKPKLDEEPVESSYQ